MMTRFDEFNRKGRLKSWSGERKMSREDIIGEVGGVVRVCGVGCAQEIGTRLARPARLYIDPFCPFV